MGIFDKLFGKGRKRDVSIQNQVAEMIRLLARIMEISQEMGCEFLSRDDDDTAGWTNESELRAEFNSQLVDEFVICHELLRKIGQELLDMGTYEGDYTFQKNAYLMIEKYFMEHKELCVTGYIPTGYIENAWRGLGGLW